ncbi:MAG: enoyl-CoA hydratase-related protein [Rubrimonas sp.]|uniref:enoyl-CoA hydratase-related protein n=1 Tax=Rubrimonas sp. TaxID=2036015 RepID=UPI002FDCFBE7
MAQGDATGDPTQAGEALLVELTDGLMRLTLNRPDRLNAIDPPLAEALLRALERAEDDDAVRAVLLRGAGRVFCAGWDLRERDPGGPEAPSDLGASLEAWMIPLIEELRHIEKPVICAVHGAAAGAGANLALACDITLAARSATFSQAYIAVGLIPDAGGTWFLTHLVGEARARALAMTGAAIDGATAAEWGMIWRAVEDDALEAEAEALARRMAQGPTVALGLTKKAIREAATHGLSVQMEIERGLQREVGRMPDYAEGVAAFFEKRPPRFTGRRR